MSHKNAASLVWHINGSNFLYKEKQENLEIFGFKDELFFNSFKMLTLTIVEKKAGYFGIGVPKYP